MLRSDEPLWFSGHRVCAEYDNYIICGAFSRIVDTTGLMVGRGDYAMQEHYCIKVRELLKHREKGQRPKLESTKKKGTEVPELQGLGLRYY